MNKKKNKNEIINEPLAGSASCVAVVGPSFGSFASSVQSRGSGAEIDREKLLVVTPKIETP